jgi:tetrapyrrole methylase family protein / MazG family protein
MPKAPENLREFAGLLKVVEFLRGPDGCPWDKEQTHQTLTRYAIEEAHELAEAIDSCDDAEIRDELGDVLLQVVLHAEIARQEKRFDIFDVIEAIGAKMVRRHPHVFGDVVARTSGEVLTNWAEIKAAEKAGKAGTEAAAVGKTPLSFDIPVGLPSLLRAQKIGEKTKKVNFDWTDAAACWPKIEEELSELRNAMAGGRAADIESELGDVLFSVAQLARHLNVDSEQALRKTNLRFEKRFVKMQALVTADGLEWMKLAEADKEKYWKRAK